MRMRKQYECVIRYVRVTGLRCSAVLLPCSQYPVHWATIVHRHKSHHNMWLIVGLQNAYVQRPAERICTEACRQYMYRDLQNAYVQRLEERICTEACRTHMYRGRQNAYVQRPAEPICIQRSAERICAEAYWTHVYIFLKSAYVQRPAERICIQNMFRWTLWCILIFDLRVAIRSIYIYNIFRKSRNNSSFKHVLLSNMPKVALMIFVFKCFHFLPKCFLF